MALGRRRLSDLVQWAKNFDTGLILNRRERFVIRLDDDGEGVGALESKKVT